MKIRDYSILAVVVLLGIVVQVALVGMDSKETPGRTAQAFARSFFKLDPAMTDYMCADLAADEEAIDNLIHEASVTARARGFSPGFMRMQLFHLQASVLMQDDQNAQVQLSSEMRRSIHPAFAAFAKMWGLGESHHLNETLDLVKEGDQWKVCDHNLKILM